jgi:hypothetical protein
VLFFQPSYSFEIGTLLWWIISLIVALFFGLSARKKILHSFRATATERFLAKG